MTQQPQQPPPDQQEPQEQEHPVTVIPSPQQQLHGQPHQQQHYQQQPYQQYGRPHGGMGGPPRGGPHHGMDYRPRPQYPPPEYMEQPPPQMAIPSEGEMMPPPISDNRSLHPSAVPYTGPIFTPGNGVVPPSSNGGQPVMRGPPYPQHHQPRMGGSGSRGPPRGGMSYGPRGSGRGQPSYYGMHQQQIPPPYMMGGQPPYMGAPAPMPYMPMNMDMRMGSGPRGGTMPMAPPHAHTAQSHPPPQARKKAPLLILDPKTGEPINFLKERGVTAESAAEDIQEAVAPTPVAAPVAATAAATPATLSSPVKEIARSPAKNKSAVSANVTTDTKPKEPGAITTADVFKANVMAIIAKEALEKAAKAGETGSEPTRPPKTTRPQKPASPSTPQHTTLASPKKTGMTSPQKTRQPKGTASPAAAVLSPSVKKTATPLASPTVVQSPEPKKNVIVTPPGILHSPIQNKIGTKSSAPSSPIKKATKTSTSSRPLINSVASITGGTITYSLQVLYHFRELYVEMPANATIDEEKNGKWPSMEATAEIVRSRGSGSRSGGPYERQTSGGVQLNRQSSRGSTSTSGGGKNNWDRGHELPKRERSERGGRGGRGGRGSGRGGAADGPVFDGPVKPLERTENRWIPIKATSNLEAAKKKVQSVMNKMTREKFEKLANQLTEINMESLAMLQTVIKIIFDKALGEPHFCDMYADLCVHLEEHWKVWSFLRIVQNDDDHMFYWTTMADADSEVVGPFTSVVEALDSAGSDEFEPTPAPSNLLLSELRIREGKFIKIWVDPEAASRHEEDGHLYWSGQLLEDLGEDQPLNGPFESYDLAQRYATKACSFKRILLNACQEEFEKDNIYEELEEAHTKAKEEGTLTPEAIADFEEKRIIMKARMLGNIRFIGELYRKGMLQERIMHECIMKLMGVKVINGSLEPHHPNVAPDEESIESLVKLLTTMGKDLEKHGKSGDAMGTYFGYLEKKLGKDKRLSSRIIFMIRDVIDMRNNRWEPRRKDMKAQSLDDIRKQADREARAPPSSGGGGGGRSDFFRADSRRSNSQRDGFTSQRQTMAPVYSSQSMSSRSSGPNRMMPLSVERRNVQRDDSVTTGPQGRPAMFGANSRRSGAMGGGAPTSRKGGNNTEPPASRAKEGNRPKSPACAPLSDSAKETITKKAIATAEEYITVADLNEAETCYNDLVKTYPSHASDVSAVIASAILKHAMVAKKDAQRTMFDFVEKLSVEKGVPTFDGVRQGIAEVVAGGSDDWCDVPKLHEHVADLVARFLKVSEKSGVSLDWLMCGCGQLIESDVLSDVIDGGFLAACCGVLLQTLRSSTSVDHIQSQIHATCQSFLSILPSHEQNQVGLKRWVEKYSIGDLLPLSPVFAFIEYWNATHDLSGVEAWLAKNVTSDVRKDPIFVTHMGLCLLARLKKDEVPTSEEEMLLTGFCVDVESQARLVAGVIQTRTDHDELKSLLKHLVKDARAIPSSAVTKWLELQNDNSLARKRVLEELRDFVEELSKSK